MNPNIEKILQTLRKEYVIIGGSRVRSWYGWLAIGLATGMVLGIALVANQRGEFESTRAASGQFDSVKISSFFEPGTLLKVNANTSDGLYHPQTVHINNCNTGETFGLCVSPPRNGDDGIAIFRYTDTNPDGNLIYVADLADTITLFSVDVWGNVAANGSIYSGLGKGGYFPVGSPAGIGASLSSMQRANSNDTIILKRATDAGPTGQFIRAMNAAESANIFYIDVNGNLVTTGDISAKNLSATGNIYSGVGKGAYFPVGSPAGIGASLSSMQGANNNDTIILKRASDIAPTGQFIRAMNATQSSNIFYIDVNGNLVTTGDISAKNLSATGNGAMPLYLQDGTSLNSGHMVVGTITLSGGSAIVNFTGAARFVSNPYCVGVDQSQKMAVRVTTTGPNSLSIAGNANDVVIFQCVGR